MEVSVGVNRVFVIGASRIADPCPNMPLEDSVRQLRLTHRQARFTEVLEEDGVLENGELVYHLHLPPVKTNG